MQNKDIISGNIITNNNDIYHSEQREESKKRLQYFAQDDVNSLTKTSYSPNTLLPYYPKKKIAFTLAEVFLPSLKAHHKVAFTLAEVLITLGVIGIVAALTISNVVTKYKDKQIVTQYNHAVSLFSQAFAKLAYDAGGDLTYYNGWANDWRTIGKGFFNSYLSIDKECIGLQVAAQDRAECFPFPTYALDKKTPSEGGGGCGLYNFAYHLSNGMSFCLSVTNVTGKQTLTIDVNGFKGPNVYGIDLFRFFVLNNGTIIPYGAYDAGSCQKDLSHPRNGSRCSEWISKYQNVDYLHKPYPNWHEKWK